MKLVLFLILFLLGQLIESKKCEDCQSLQGKILPSTQYNPKDAKHHQDRRNTKITLNAGKYNAYPNLDGSFEFNNIPPGKYLLEVSSILFHYDKLIVEIPPFHTKFKFNIEVFIWNPYTSKKIKSAYPLELRSEIMYQYFEKVEEMTLGSLVKNQYFIMVGISVLMLFFVKKMPNLEELQQQEAEQQKVESAPPS